jgi:diketogulonate reductase-like aldo/keto reductase
MRTETLPNGEPIDKIGFGTWSIGGETRPDHKLDEKSLAALRSALDLGYTHFDTAEYYAAGHAEALLGQAVRASKIKREDLFITTKVMPTHLKYAEVLQACDRSLKHLGMDYVDLYLIHWPQIGMQLEETFRALNKLVHTGKVRHLGVSNFKLKHLKQSQELSETPIITNQIPYRLPDREYVKNGVIEYCQQNNILITAYSPVKFRAVRVNKVTNAIAAAHNTTPYQIALAWLVNQPKVITIPMSFDPRHQAENLAAADITLSPAEMDQLNSAYA